MQRTPGNVDVSRELIDIHQHPIDMKALCWHASDGAQESRAALGNVVDDVIALGLVSPRWQTGAFSNVLSLAI